MGRPTVRGRRVDASQVETKRMSCLGGEMQMEECHTRRRALIKRFSSVTERGTYARRSAS